MKSKMLFLFLCAIGPAIAKETTTPLEEAKEIKQAFGYFSAGLGPFPLPLPTFGAGFRKQTGHHGVDLSLQASTVVAFTQVKANLLYHYYFKPSLSSQFYVGGGVGPSVIFGNNNWDHSGKGHLFLSPEFVFGKQYRNESHDLRFLQMQVSFPTMALKGSHAHVCKFPLVIISYGIGF